MRTRDRVQEDNKRTDLRRGRIPHATYVQVVGQALARDWFRLESFDILTQLDLVQHLVSTYPEKYPSSGWAVRALLDKAIDDVVALCRSHPDVTNSRIVDFLESRRSGMSVSAIALRWNLSRECVSRTIGRKASFLVTERVLVRNRRKIRPVTADPVPLASQPVAQWPLSHTA